MNAGTVEPRRVRIPASHVDLLDRPFDAVLTTEMPDGRLQSTVVWFSRDGEDVVLNTMREFQKARNLLARPRATLLVMESPRAERWIEVRGIATAAEQGAGAHLDALAQAYAGVDRFFGGAVPAGLATVEHPILFRVRPVAVTVGPSTITAPRTRCSPTRRLLPASGCARERDIPASHRDLLELPVLASLSTALRSGAQTHPTWFELDRNDIMINTTLERAKGRNLIRDPRATVLVVDPVNSNRWIEIRGDVDLSEEGAVEQLDRLTRRYTIHPAFYGYVDPLDMIGPG
jgi:PPOX class probable F420-dependent enzyme